MVRDVALLGAAMMALQVACPHANSAPVTEVHGRHPHHQALASLLPATVHKTIARRRVNRATTEPTPVEAALQLPAPVVDTSDGAPTPLAFHAAIAPVTPADLPAEMWATNVDALPVPALPSTPPALSDQETEAGQLANDQGDRTFLMVDKTLGKVILFEKGQPVFAGPALTGASLADQMPKTELGAKFDTLNTLDTKITPAGRYTVQRGYDPEVGGPLFDISEIHGKDWGIAIHQVYLGTPSEHRDARIKSPGVEDKHITFGCINVKPEALRLFLHELPAKGKIPLYVLPEDASQTAIYLTPHASS
jgi:hypothetical protein